MRLMLAALACTVLTACAVPANREVDSPYVRQQILDATAAWANAYNSRDPARIAAQYAPNAVFWGTTAKTIANTPQAIAEYFKSAPQNPQARVTFGPENIHMWGDLATNSGYYTFNDVRDGKPVQVPARYTMVFRHDGVRWQIVEHHSSRIP
jgi:hypothetical protein